MDLNEVLATAVDPALALLPADMTSAKARTMLLAIGLQESRLEHQRQIGGPAVGLWQFELGGGIKGVMSHPASRDHARLVCEARGVMPSPRAVYDALAGTDDVLDAAFARLLLWTDPKPLPKIGDAQGAWDYYLRTWRPGTPHPETWGKLYDKAAFAVLRYQQAAA